MIATQSRGIRSVSYTHLDPAAQSEVIDVLKSLLEQVGYGKMSAQEAGEEFFTKANDILQAA